MSREKDEYLEKKRRQRAKYVFNPKGAFIFAIIVVMFGLTGFAKAWYSDAVNGWFGFNAYKEKISSNDLQVHFINIGQGDAIAIRLPDNKTMLIDAGPRKCSDALKNYLKNVFFDNQKCVFDYVVLTHSDSDHCGGMEMVYDLCYVKQSFRPTMYSDSAKNEMPYNDLNADISINNYYADYIDSIYEETNSSVLYLTSAINYKNFPNGYIRGISNKYPNQEYSVTFLTNNQINYNESNDCSAVILLEYAGRSMLFTGDAEADGFSEIDDAITELDIHNITLYKASHHGSVANGANNSVTLNNLNPEYVAISVGKDNSYGHPHEDLMSTLYDLGVQNNKILRTDKSGSCIFAVRGDSDLGKVLVSKNVLHKEPIPYAWEFTYLFVLIIAFILCFINRERVKMKDMTDNF